MSLVNFNSSAASAASADACADVLELFACAWGEVTVCETFAPPRRPERIRPRGTPVYHVIVWRGGAGRYEVLNGISCPW